MVMTGLFSLVCDRKLGVSTTFIAFHLGYSLCEIVISYLMLQIHQVIGT